MGAIKRDALLLRTHRAKNKADGQLRAELDSELIINLPFGRIVFQLFNGFDPLDEDGAF